MAGSAKQRTIDDLMSKAAETLSRKKWFEAERLAMKALAMARQEHEFERMARICATLAKARMNRFRQAVDARRRITILSEPVTEDMKIKPGCYLIRPPQVGADARRLKLAALATDIPVIALCREPLTRLKEVPIVAISPGITVRTRVDPPADIEQPGLNWLVSCMEALGNWAIENLDPTLPPVRKVDALLERLDAVSEHEALHHALAEACLDAHRAHTSEKALAAARADAKSKSSAAAAVEEFDGDADGDAVVDGE